MNEVDNRIVQLEFDNSQFEKNASQTINTLDRLKTSLDFSDSTSELKSFEQVAQNMSYDKITTGLTNIGESVDSIANKFTLMGTIGQKVINQLADTIINATKSAVGFFTFDNLSAGFSKYSASTKATQTILAAIKDTAEYGGDAVRATQDINSTLAKLQKYTDETSYSFADMSATIGRFVAVGVGLEDAELAMEGIANAAAKAGVGVQGANMAMSQIAQAMAKGYFQVIDWQSLENYNIATADFNQQMIDAAVAVGTLKMGSDGFARTAKGTVVEAQNLRSTLREGWLTSDVFLQAMTVYGDTSTAFGREAFEAAQKALTLSDAIQAIRDAMSTGWMNSFTYIFGDLEESIELWTDFCNAIIEVTSAIDGWRNAALEAWHDAGGRDIGLQGLAEIGTSLLSILDAIKAAYASVFESFNLDGTVGFDNFLNGLMRISEELLAVGNFFQTLFGYNISEDAQKLIDKDERKNGGDNVYRDRVVVNDTVYRDSEGNEYFGFDAAREARKGYKTKAREARAKMYAGTTDAERRAAFWEMQKYENLAKSVKKVKVEPDTEDEESPTLSKTFKRGDRDSSAKTGKKKKKQTAADKKRVQQFTDSDDFDGSDGSDKDTETRFKNTSGQYIDPEEMTVAMIQNAMNVLMPNGKQLAEDGVFGAATEAAVREFQKKNGLKVTGEYDKATHDKVQELLGNTQGEFLMAGQAVYFDKSNGLRTIQNIAELIMAISEQIMQAGTFAIRAAALVLNTIQPIIDFAFSIVGFVAQMLSTIIECINMTQRFEIALDVMKTILDPIGDILFEIFDTTSSWLHDMGDYIQNTILVVFSKLLEILSSVLSVIGATVADLALGAFTELKNLFEAIALYKQLVGEGFDFSDENWITTLTEKLKAEGKDTGIVKYLETIVKVVNWFKGLSFSGVGKFFEDLFGKKIVSGIKDFVSNIKLYSQAIKEFIKFIFGKKTEDEKANYMEQLFRVNPKLGEAFQKVSNFWNKYIAPVIEQAKTFAGTIFSSIGSAIAKVPDLASKVWNFFSSTLDKIKKKWAKTKLDKSRNKINGGGFFENLFSGITDFFSANGGFFGTLTAIWEKLSGWFSKVYDQIVNSSTWKTLSDALATGFDYIIQVGNRFGRFLAKTFGGIFEVLFPQEDENLGAVDTFGNAASKLDGAVSTFDSVIEWFKTNVAPKFQAILDFLFPKSDSNNSDVGNVVSSTATTITTASGEIEQSGTFLQNALDFIKQLISDFVEFLSSIFGFEWNGGKEKSLIGDATESIGSEEDAAKAEEKVSFFKNTIETLKTVFNDIMQFFGSIFGFEWKNPWGEKDGENPVDKAAEVATGSDSKIEKIQSFGEKVEAVFEKIKAIFQKIIDWFAYIFGMSDKDPSEEVNEVIDNGEETAKKAGGLASTIDGIISTLTNIWNSVRNFIAMVFGLEIENAGGETNPIQEAVDKVDVPDGTEEKAKTLAEKIDSIVEWLTTAWTNIVNFFKNLFGGGSNETDSAASEASKTAENAFTIGGLIDSVINFLTPIWNKIRTFIATIFGLKLPGGDSEPLNGLIDGTIGNIASEDAVKSLEEAQTLGEKIDNIIQTIVTTISNIVNGIIEFFNALFAPKQAEPVDPRNQAIAGPEFVAPLKNSETNLEQAKTIGEKIQGILDSILAAKDWIVEKATIVWNWITNIFGKKTDGSSAESNGESLASTLESESNIFVRIGDALASIVNAIVSLFDSSDGKSFGDKITEFVENLIAPIQKFFEGVSGVTEEIDEGTAEEADGAKSTADWFVSVIDFFNNIINGLAGLVGAGLGNILKYVGTLIKTIAGLFVAYEFFRAIRTFIVMMEDVTSVMSVPWEIAHWGGIILSIIVLMALIKQVSKLEWEDVGKVAVVMAAMTFIMFVVGNGLVKIFDMSNKISVANAKQLASGLFNFALIIIAIGACCLLIAGAARLLHDVTIADMIKLGVIIAGLALLAFIAAKTEIISKLGAIDKFNPAAGSGLAIMMIGIAAIAVALAFTCRIFANMSWDQLGKAALGLAAMVAALVLIMGAMVKLSAAIATSGALGKNFTGAIKALSGSLLSIVIALAGMTAILFVLSLMSTEMFWSGAARLAVIATILVVIFAVIGYMAKVVSAGNAKNPKVIAEFAKLVTAIWAIGVAILAISVSLLILSKIEEQDFFDGIFKMILILGLILVFLKVATNLTSKTEKNVLKNAQSLMGLVGVALIIAVIAAALWVIKDVNTSTVVTFTLALTLIIGALALVLREVSNISSNKTSMTALMTLVGIALIIGVIAAALWVITEFDIKTGTIVAFITSLAIIIAAIALLMFTIGKLSKLSSSFGAFMVIVAIIGLIAVLMGGLVVLTKQGIDIESINSFFLMVSLLMVSIGAFVVSMAVVSGIPVAVLAKAAAVMAIVAVLTAALIGALCVFDTFSGGLIKKMFAKVGEWFGAFKAAQFKQLGGAMKDVQDMGIDPSVFNDTLLPLFTSMNEFSSGVADQNSADDGWFDRLFGRTKMQKLAQGIRDLGLAIITIQKGLDGVSTIDTVKFTAIANAAKPLRDLAKSFDNIEFGSFQEKKTGNTSWEKFIDTIALFAGKMVTMNSKISGISNATEFQNKITKIVGAATSIANLAKQFALADGTAMDMGGTYTHSHFFSGESSTTTTGWIGFINSLDAFATQIPAMDAQLSTVDEGEVQSLANKIKKITPAIEGIAGIYTAVASIPPMTEGDVDAAAAFADRFIDDQTNEKGIFSTSWGQFIAGIGPLFDSFMSASTPVYDYLQSINTKGDDFVNKYINPVVTACDGIAKIYTALSAVEITEVGRDENGIKIFENTAFLDFLNQLAGDGTSENPGFANQMLAYANIISGFYKDENGDWQQVSNALNTANNGKLSFSTISENVVAAAQGIADIVTTVAAAQQTLASTGNITGLTLFGEDGLFTQFMEAIGKTEDQPGEEDFLSFGEAVTNYANLIKGLTSTEYEFPDNADAAMNAITKIAQFMYALGGGTDANGNAFALDESIFDNTGWDRWWGTDGLFYKFTRAMAGTDEYQTSLGEAIVSFWKSVNSLFVGEDGNQMKNVDATVYSKRSEAIIGTLTDIANFINSITDASKETAISHGSFDTFNAFVSSIWNSAKYMGEGSKGNGLSGALRELFDSTAQYEKINGVNAVKERVSNAMEALREIAQFITELVGTEEEASKYSMPGQESGSNFSLQYFITPFGEIIKCIDAVGDLDEGSLSSLTLLSKAIREMGRVILLIKGTASDGTDPTVILASIASIFTSLSEGLGSKDWTNSFDGEELVKAINDFTGAINTSLSEATTALNTNIDNYTSAGQALGSALATTISSGISQYSNSDDYGISGLSDNVVSASKGSDSSMKGIGNRWGGAIASGLKDSTVVYKAIQAVSSLCDKIIAAANAKFGVASPSKVFYGIGRWCSVGLANGLRGSAFLAARESAYTAKLAINALIDNVQTGSPSRVFYGIGSQLDESIASGITSSTTEIEASARSMMQKALSTISTMLEEDINTEPTIRPVVDLSDVSRAGSMIGSIIPSATKLGITSSDLAKKASATMNKTNQNDTSATSTYNNQSYGGINFSGATFNVRSDRDIRSLASELAAINTANLQSHGVLS